MLPQTPVFFMYANAPPPPPQEPNKNKTKNMNKKKQTNKNASSSTVLVYKVSSGEVQIKFLRENQSSFSFPATDDIPWVPADQLAKLSHYRLVSNAAGFFAE